MPYQPKSGDIDLGSGVFVRILHAYSSGDEIGGILIHPVAGATAHDRDGDAHPPGSDSAGADWCEGAFWWDGKHKENWTVNAREPLDLSPSLKCHCDFHGFIKAGRWVPA